MRVYGDLKSGNCFKIKLALNQLGVQHEWVHVDILKGETHAPAFLAMNPVGQIPVLEITPGQFLPESNAILHWLAEGSDLLPADRLQHAQVLQWMFFEQYKHEPTVAVARFIVRYLGRPPAREEKLQQCLRDGAVALGVMENHLAGRTFFVAETYTIADIALYAYTHVAHEGGFDLTPYPNLGAWLQRVKALPGYVGMDG